MSLSKKPYRGTRDFFPPAQRVQEFMFSKMRETAALFGYECYDGPLLEEVELYKAKSGEELINDQIYSFMDRGERFVAIRPEMTPTLARMVSQIHREYPKPIRWFSIPNLMRYEKPQKGRLREHWQFNCDIFGAENRRGEIEILQMAIFLFQSFGANSQHFEVLINDRAIVDTVFEKILKLNSETSYKLYKIVDRAKKVSFEALDKMIKELELDENRNKIIHEYLSLNSFEGVINFLKNNNEDLIASTFSNFIEQVKDLSLEEYLIYDPTIVRGLDYYTGIVFEIFDKHPDNRRALSGGGAYANLLQIFNESPVPGVGFGLGDVTLRNFLEVHNLLPDLSKPENDLFLTFQDEKAQNAINILAMSLRKEGVKVVAALEPLKFKKVFPLAEKRGSSFVGLLGSNELENNLIQIKNLSSKTQESFSLTDIKKIVEFISQ